MLENISVVGWIVLGVAATFIGVSKTGFPGAGVLAIPLVAMVIPAKASTGLILPMLIVGDIFAVAYYRRHAVWKHLVKLIPFAALGIVIGYFLLGKVNDQQLKPIIGCIILVMLSLSYLRNRRRLDEKIIPASTAGLEAQASPEIKTFTGAWWRELVAQLWFPMCMGLIAGVTTMMANAAGPIMVIYLMAMRLPKNEFVGTGAWYFLILNCFKVPFSQNLDLINATSIKFNLILLPLIVVGALVGVPLLKRVPEKGFTTLVQILAALGAAWLVAQSFI